MDDRTTDDEPSQDPAATAALLALLQQAPLLFTRAGELAHFPPQPGSAAASDAAGPLGHHTRILAAESLANGAEHLVIWQRLFEKAKVQPIGAHMTLLRAAMEGAVTCRWLVDGQVDSMERVRRGIALLHEDYTHRADFERDAGTPQDVTAPAKTARARLRELESARRAARLDRGSVQGLTSLFANYAMPSGPTGRSVYRLMSAYAHGRQWASLTSDLRYLDTGTGVPGGVVARVSASDSLSVTMTRIAVLTLAKALREMETYLGAEPAP